MTPGAARIVKGQMFSFSLGNDLAELDQLHANVEGFGALHELEKKAIFETKLVLEEIFTNIISYGHPDNSRHQVEFSLRYTNNILTIRVEDDGVPFNLLDADPVDPGSDLEKRSAGGLGIHLIRKMMDEVTYKRTETKNVVTLRKKFVNIEVD